MSDNFDLMDVFKKGFLAGVGAISTGYEKGKEVVDVLVDKGQITVEQGKTLNQELKHKLDDAVADSKARAEQNKKTDDQVKAAKQAVKDNDFSDFVSKLTPEQVEALKKVLNDKPADEAAAAEEAPAEDDSAKE
jgi:polyhydroxyalkanoate synthesis regulator phasin